MRKMLNKNNFVQWVLRAWYLVRHFMVGETRPTLTKNLKSDPIRAIQKSVLVRGSYRNSDYECF